MESLVLKFTLNETLIYNMVAKTIRIQKKDYAKENRVPVELGAEDRGMLRELNAYWGMLSDTCVVRFGLRRLLENHSEISIKNYLGPAGEDHRLAQISLPGIWKVAMIRLRDHFEFSSVSELVRYIIRKEFDGIQNARKRSEKFCATLEIQDPATSAS